MTVDALTRALEVQGHRWWTKVNIGELNILGLATEYNLFSSVGVDSKDSDKQQPTVSCELFDNLVQQTRRDLLTLKAAGITDLAKFVRGVHENVQLPVRVQLELSAPNNHATSVRSVSVCECGHATLKKLLPVEG